MFLSFQRLGYDRKDLYHITFPFLHLNFQILSKWKESYKNSVILAAPSVVIVLHAPPYPDRVLMFEIITKGLRISI
jgi:hypothetical protein